MAAASRKTGLSDWGDESFRIPFQILLESYRKDARLNFVGWLLLHRDLIKYLSNRLLIREELKRHPEILQKPVHRPLFIVSLPRTGTTLLQELLAHDPSNRSLLFWEAHRPSPSPDPHTRETDPRIKEAEKDLRYMHAMAPGYASMHLSLARGPHECIPLLSNSFASSSFYAFANLPRYAEWLREQDMLPTYLYYRQQLQILQWRCPGDRWLLKSPVHLYSLDELLAVFPDACIVQTHRDPLSIVPSGCSILSTIQGIRSDHVDPVHLSREWLRDMEFTMERVTKARDSADSARFFDVYYKDIVQDPIETVRHIYEHFRYDFTDRFEQGMCKWLAANPQHKHGVHRYSLEQFGLNKDIVNRYFAKYCERFHISSG